MKILTVIESLGCGGAEQALVNLLPLLKARDHQCQVVALWPPYDIAPALEHYGIALHPLNIKGRWNLPQAVLRLAQAVRQVQPDVVHAHLFFASLYSALTRPLMPGPVRVVTFHNLAYDSYPADTAWKRVRKGLDGIVTRRWMDGASAVSRAVAENYASHLRLGAVRVIPNAVATTVASPVGSAELKSALGFSSDDFLIVLPGRLRKEKGHVFLLKALRILAERALYPKLLIVGDGPLWNEIAVQVEHSNLGGQAAMRHMIPHDDLMKIMAGADLVVIPSLFEGLGLVAAEAMALGRPVVTTRVGGLAELVEDGVSGLLVPRGDAAALAAAIARLMNDSPLRERLGQAACQPIRARFAPAIVAEQWERFYCELGAATSRKRSAIATETLLH